MDLRINRFAKRLIPALFAGRCMIRFFTSVAREQNGHLDREAPGLVNVLLSTHDPTPVGVAFPMGLNDVGLRLWTLYIDGVELPGQWTIVGREFVAER